MWTCNAPLTLTKTEGLVLNPPRDWKITSTAGKDEAEIGDAELHLLKQKNMQIVWKLCPNSVFSRIMKVNKGPKQ